MIALGSWSVPSFAGLSQLIELHFQYQKASAWSVFSPSDSLSSSEFSAPVSLRSLYKQAQHFISQDIVRLLSTPERGTHLKTYLREGDQLLGALEKYKNQLQLQLQQLDAQTQSCENQLELANQLFSSSVEQNQESWFERAVSEAKKARACLGEQRVLKNAKNALLTKLQKLQFVIAPRITYLKTHQDLIIKHYDILKPSLLSELYRLSLQVGPKS